MFQYFKLMKSPIIGVFYIFRERRIFIMNEINGLNSVPTNTTVNQNVTGANEQEQTQPNSIFFSRFDSNKDSIVSKQEQKQSFVEKFRDYWGNLQQKYNISLDNFLDSSGKLNDIKTDGTKENAISTDNRVNSVLYRLDSALIDKVTEIDLNNNLAAVSDDNTGLPVDYIRNKITAAGVKFDVSDLEGMISKFDWDIAGADNEGMVNKTILTQNANQYGKSQFMNTDSAGNAVDTKVLDFFANQYIATHNE